MNKIMRVLTIEFDKENELAELHLNKKGAKYLRELLDKLIETDEQDHFHLMTKDWGGDELTMEKQNQSEEVDLLHQLKIMYWKS